MLLAHAARSGRSIARQPPAVAAAALSSQASAPVVAWGDRVVLYAKVEDCVRWDGHKTHDDVPNFEAYSLIADDDVFDDAGCSLFPPSFIVGEGKLLRGLEQGLVGMTKFEPKTVEVKNFFFKPHKHAGQSVLLKVTVVDHEPRAELDEDEQLVLPEVIKEGDGATFPEFGDKIVVDYTMKAVDTGEELCSSDWDDEYSNLTLEQDDAMDEGIRLMSKGEKARLHIPEGKRCHFRDDYEGDVVVDVFKPSRKFLPIPRKSFLEQFKGVLERERESLKRQGDSS